MALKDKDKNERNDRENKLSCLLHEDVWDDSNAHKDVEHHEQVEGTKDPHVDERESRVDNETNNLKSVIETGHEVTYLWHHRWLE